MLYAALAVLTWTLWFDDGSPLVWLAKITFTVVALYFLAAWYVRRSREGEGEEAG
ncbi:hypothetical protein [Kineococcus auxinigenes]|uniref:hypothetical protein n=1 Tax=unclassified Kineococcus TaxID=2621656 RepID=UPI003D7E786D